MSAIFHNNKTRITATPNEKYTWYFHNWRSNALKGQAPTAAEETKVRKWLCQKPNMSYIKNYYKDNLKLSPSATQSACNSSSGNRIKLRDTESYISEVVQRLVNEKGLAAGDFIQVINGID
ncbi:hypothetical protein [Colwellia sp. TT2012]|uniref:hypothetical protein n=1 Tax=Colwellia sp. TT2012 TaxID=1720342 RepID=UPI0012FB1AA0|nr:hypothetical protein [Colwellia sp. TT2012]